MHSPSSTNPLKAASPSWAPEFLKPNQLITGCTRRLQSAKVFGARDLRSPQEKIYSTYLAIRIR